MNTQRKLAPAILSLAAFLFLGLSNPGPAHAQTAAEASLSSRGFDISMGELFELLSFQRSVRLDPQAKVEADWSRRFEGILLRDIGKSENRYAFAIDARKKRQIIAIRGTANLMNALLDLESWKDVSPALGIRLHHGFERAATLVFEDVRLFLDRTVPIIVCGHSLGAAESIILGMLLSKAGYTLEKIVASGPPKVTDAAGTALYASLPLVLVTAAFDPVPFLPPASLYPKQPFIQGGPLLMLLDGPYVTVAPPAYYEAMSQAFKEVKLLSEHFDVVDHRVWTYCDRAGEKASGVMFVPFSEWQAYAVPRK